MQTNTLLQSCATPQQSRDITQFVDAENRPCTCVQLANSTQYAVLLTEDFDRLIASGLTCNWGLNYNHKGGQSYVCASIRKANTVSVARLIAGARWKQAVRYRNGNRLDLRPENLRVSSGGRAYKDCTSLLKIEQDRSLS